MSKRKGDLNISLEAKQAGHKADEKQSKKEGQVAHTLIINAFKELWKHHPQQVTNRWPSDEAIVNALIGVYHHDDTSLDTGSFNGAMSRATFYWCSIIAVAMPSAEKTRWLHGE